MNQFFGFDYVSAIGLAAAMILIVGASYLLVTGDSIPIDAEFIDVSFPK